MPSAGVSFAAAAAGTGAAGKKPEMAGCCGGCCCGSWKDVEVKEGTVNGAGEETLFDDLAKSYFGLSFDQSADGIVSPGEVYEILSAMAPADVERTTGLALDEFNDGAENLFSAIFETTKDGMVVEEAAELVMAQEEATKGRGAVTDLKDAVFDLMGEQSSNGAWKNLSPHVITLCGVSSSSIAAAAAAAAADIASNDEQLRHLQDEAVLNTLLTIMCLETNASSYSYLWSLTVNKAARFIASITGWKHVEVTFDETTGGPVFGGLALPDQVRSILT